MRVEATVQVDAPAGKVWVAPGSSFSWQTASPGITTTATHVVRALPADRAELTVGVDQSGPMAWLVGLLAGRRTARYLRMEANGLKRCAEASGG